MPFPVQEYRLVQERTFTSAADAVFCALSTIVVPAGKIWTLIGVSYRPSAAETRTICFSKISATGAEFSLLNPITVQLSPTGNTATPLEQGSFIDLLPGEYIRVVRDTATAGSTMIVKLQFVEWDMPLYDYVEPQLEKRIRSFGTSVRRVIASGGGAGPSGGSGFGGGDRGGRPGPGSIPK